MELEDLPDFIFGCFLRPFHVIWIIALVIWIAVVFVFPNENSLQWGVSGCVALIIMALLFLGVSNVVRTRKKNWDID